MEILPTVAVIGLGQIGLPFARRLLEHGFPVLGWRRGSTAAFEKYGGVRAVSPADAARRAAVLVQCLPSEAALAEAGLGADGVLAGAHRGLVVIETSSHGLAAKLRYRDALAACGATLLDVEVSGTTAMASRGEATLFLSGDLEVLTSVEPVLAALSSRRQVVGEFGAATRLKLVANLLVTLHTAAAAEAIALAECLGLDPNAAIDALESTAAGSAMLRLRGPRIASREFAVDPGPIETMRKYLDAVAADAADAGLRLPLFEAARGQLNAALAAGMGGDDIGALVRLLRAT